MSVCYVCRVITFLMWKWQHFLLAAFRPNSKDVQSIDSEEGEKIISHLRYCHCSEEDKELKWHWISYIFYILSHKVIAYSCTETLPVHMCVGETGTWCEVWEKINKTGQKPLVIMTHGDDFWRAVVQNNIQFRKMLLPNGHYPTCELFWNQKLLQTSLRLKKYSKIWIKNN